MTKQQTAPVARQLSVEAVMAAILREGATSRAMLAKLTGLSRQTTTQVVLELERDGWLTVTGRMQGPVGRSAPTYDLNPNAAYVLGIRLEGAIVQLALANIRGDVVAEVSEPTAREGGLDVVRQIGGLFGAVLTKAGVARDMVRLAAMGSPGVVDPKSGHISIAPSIPGLDHLNVVEALGAELALPLSIENGVKLAALGELWQGEARGARDFVYLAIGRGVGMGIVSQGRLLRGTRGAAGEIAYLPLGGDPFDPAHRAHGTFETAANSDALVRRYLGYGGAPGRSAGDVLASAAQGDEAAISALEESARLIVQAISAVCAALDPERIILGGSIGAHPELIRRVRALLPRAVPEPMPVKAGALGDRASLVGALGQALDRLHAELFGVDAMHRDISLTETVAVTRDGG